MNTARIVIADDHALAREGLRAMLERSGRFCVVGEAETGENALRLCAELAPDLALLDIRYGTQAGRAGPRQGAMTSACWQSAWAKPAACCAPANRRCARARSGSAS